MLKEEEENLKRKGLWIEELSATDVGADIERIGLKGSPTKVKKIQSVVLTGADFKDVPPTDSGVNSLIHELIEDHTLG
jgi:electron transfer flavoprotein beta subunit